MRDVPGPDFWERLRARTGAVRHSGPVAGSFSSDITAVVDAEQGRFFVKAMRNRPGGRRDSIVREKVVNPYVQPISPALLWDVEDDEWLILGFEFVEGRPVDFLPGSGDLSRLVGVLDAIGGLDVPEVAREWTEDRWDRFTAGDDEVELLRGDTLIHGDVNPSNYLFGERNAWAVDWSWPTRGAAFIDPATLVVQLVSAGHAPEQAERRVSGCAGWKNADPDGIDVFAAATARMWRSFAERDPNARWLTAMAAAARAWAEHRGVAP